MTLTVLTSRFRRIAGDRLIGLRYVSRRGEVVTLPVAAAHRHGELLVLVGNSRRKTWWRHFRTPAQLDVLLDGTWRPATARVLRDDERPAGIEAYRASVPRAPDPSVDPLIAITPAGRPIEPTARPASDAGRRLWRSWFAWVTLGEFLGFAAPATVGATASTWPNPTMAAALLAAGVVEGAVLGAAQAHVLRRVVPRLRARRFIAATSMGAAVAYALALLPMLTAGHLDGVPVWLRLALGVALGIVLLLTIGTAQWMVLRTAAPSAASWIPMTAAAWACGLLVFTLITTPLWHEGQSTLAVAGIGVIGGLAMAAVVAGVTGVVVVRIAADRTQPPTVHGAAVE